MNKLKCENIKLGEDPIKPLNLGQLTICNGHSPSGKFKMQNGKKSNKLEVQRTIKLFEKSFAIFIKKNWNNSGKLSKR